MSATFDKGINTKLRILLLGILFLGASSRDGQSQDEFGPTDEATNTVARVYREVLNREPDPTGMETYVPMLRDGKDEQWLRSVLKSSPEYRNRIKARRQAVIRNIVAPLLCFVALYLITPLFNHRTFLYVFLAVTSLCVAGVFYASILRLAVNVPSWDDFDAILPYANLPFSERMRALFAAHNIHRLVATKLLVELSLLAFDVVDFKFMTLAMNSTLLGIAALFWVEWRKVLPLRYFLLVPVLLFTPQPWVAMMHPMQYNLLLCFALCAVVSAARLARWRGLAASTGLAIMATFTMASGVFTFPVIALLAMATVFCGARSERKGVQLCCRGIRTADLFIVAVPVLATAIGASLYFAHLSVFGHGIDPATAHPSVRVFPALHYSLLFAGSFMGEHLALAGGIVLVSCFAYATVRKAWLSWPVLYFFALFILMNVLAGAIMRMPVGISPLDQRYTAFSLMLTISSLGLAIGLFPRLFRKRYVFALAATLVCWWHVDSLGTSEVRRARHRRTLIAETSNWIARRHGLHYPREGMQHAGAIFDESLAKGTYVVPREIRERLNVDGRTSR